MPYDPLLVQPMREELSRIGIQELMDELQVEAFMSQPGTKLVVVNSVCGCAAGQARPAVAIALQHGAKPDHVGTVFAGQDISATAKVRSFFPQIPPSSPCAALIKDGEVVWFLPRHMIESRDAQTIAFDIVGAFDEHCASA